MSSARRLPIVALLLIASNALRAQPIEPDWFNRVQFFQAFGGYFIGPNEATWDGLYTGQAWAFTPDASWTTDDLIAREFEAWHRVGAICIPGLPVTMYTSDLPPPVPDSDLMVDLDGRPLIENLFNTFKRYSIFSPAWREHLRDQMKRIIDKGADGINFDSWYEPIWSIAKWTGQPGSFDTYTMSAFREHLRKKFSARDLTALFSIDNIDTFHFGNWIKQHGAENTWNDIPYPPLTREFHVFLTLGVTTFFRELVAFAHGYAEQQYSRPFTVTTNGFGNHSLVLLGDVDYVTSEHFAFQGMSGVAPFANSTIRATRSIRQIPVVVLTEIGRSDLPKQTTNMLKVVLADVYASGGSAVFSRAIGDGVNNPHDVDPAVLNRYAAFIRNNPRLFEGLIPEVDVGLLYSMASIEAATLSQDPNAVLGWGNHFDGTSQLLIDSNIQYVAVFAPSEELSDMPSVNMADLRAHDLIVVPHAPMLSDSQADNLMTYIREGGTIVAHGQIGIDDSRGVPVQRPELLALQTGRGAKKIGAGTFVYTPEFVGQAYLSGEANQVSAAEEEFVAMLSPLLSPKVSTGPVSEVHRSGGATAFLYQNSLGSRICHVVNYDYDPVSDDLAIKRDVTVRLRSDLLDANAVIYFSPDRPAPEVLPLASVGSHFEVTVPVLEAYAVLVFQRTESVPRFLGSPPSEVATVEAGTEKHFVAEVVDDDGNILSYQWYVDGEPQSAGSGPLFGHSWPVSAAGRHIVEVEVSDGLTVVRQSWTVVVFPRAGRTLGFDESHGQRNSTSFERAREIYPDHPEFDSFSELAKRLSPEFASVRLTGQPLSAEDLRSLSALVVPPPTVGFTADEVSAIMSFVAQGGGLFVLGDANVSPAVNEILTAYGIRLIPGQILDGAADPKCCGGFRDFARHPALGQQPHGYGIEFGSSLEVDRSSPATVLAWLGAESWRDANGNEFFDPGEARGPFPMLAVLNHGQGRVAVIADNAFHDANLARQQGSFSDNVGLFASLVAWLTEDRGSIPHLFPTGVVGAGLSNPAVRVLSPNGLISVFGSNIAETGTLRLGGLEDLTDAGALPTTLADTCLEIDGKRAPVLAVTESQVNGQTPGLSANSRTKLSVIRNCGSAKEFRSNQVDVDVRTSSPEFFYFMTELSGRNPIAAIHAATGTFIGSPGLIEGVHFAPAQPGDWITMFATGLGLTTPVIQPGTLPAEAARVSGSVALEVGGAQVDPSDISYVGATPGFAGLYQINVRLRPGLPDGDHAVVLTVDGNSSPEGPFVSVRGPG